jgi:hypothetical protein
MIRAMGAVSASDVTIQTVGKAKHDPVILGQPVVCFDGEEFAGPGFTGTGDPFRNQNNAVRGCELNTLKNPATGAVGLQTVGHPLRGVKLVNVDRLDFDYAGGPGGNGSPRWSIPIDEDGDHVFEFAPDGTEEYAFIDVIGCNDGDQYVGRIRGQDASACGVTYKSVTYGNWSLFAGTFPDGRVGGPFGPTYAPQKADPFIAIDASAAGHYLIFHVAELPK